MRTTAAACDDVGRESETACAVVVTIACVIVVAVGASATLGALAYPLDLHTPTFLPFFESPSDWVAAS